MNPMNPTNPLVTWLDSALPGSAWRPSATVVGALLNDRAEWSALGDAAQAPPYKGRARAPVLQVKPRNTLVGNGAKVEVPAGAAALEVGATLAIVIGATACRVGSSEAMRCVAGYTLAADLRVPTSGPQAHYRPAVRQRARDGFCPIGPRIVPAAAIASPDELWIEVAVDGQLVQRAGTAGRVRGVATLIADVSAFMTLHPGDILLLGAPADAQQVAAGRQVSLTLPAIGTLHFALVSEGAHGAGASLVPPSGAAA